MSKCTSVLDLDILINKSTKSNIGFLKSPKKNTRGNAKQSEAKPIIMFCSL
jgi:hypothetical protein